MLATTSLNLAANGDLTYVGDDEANWLTLSVSADTLTYIVTPGSEDTITIGTLPDGVTSSGGGEPGAPASIISSTIDDVQAVKINLLAGDDTVLVQSTADPTEINFGADDDTLLGPDVNTDWTLTAPGAGTQGTLVTFGSAESLTGGSAADVFALNFDLSGTVSGGAGADQFALATGVTVGSIAGGSDSDELIADDAVNTWIVSATNAGTFNDQSFSEIESFRGGTGLDTLTVRGTNSSDSFVISGTTIDVNSGAATADYSGIEELTAEGGSGADTFHVTAGVSTIITVDGQESGDTLNLDGEGLGVVLEQRQVTLGGRQPVNWTADTEQFSFSSPPGRILNPLNLSTVRQAFDPLISFGREVERLGVLGEALPGIGEKLPFSATAVIDGTSTSVVRENAGGDSTDNTIVAIAERDAETFDAANIAADAITLGLHTLSVGQRVRFDEDASGTITELSSGNEYFVVDATKTTVQLSTAIDGSAISFNAPSGTGHQLLPVHHFVNGQEVRYVADSPNAIGGLTTGKPYFVVNARGDEFQLAETRGGPAIEVIPATSGTTHRLEIVPIAGGELSVGKVAGFSSLFGSLQYYFEEYISPTSPPTVAGLVNAMNAVTSESIAAADPAVQGDLQLGPLLVSSFGTVTESFSFGTDGVPRVRFDFDVDGTRTTAFDMDFTEEADTLGLLPGGDVNANLETANLVELLSVIDVNGLAFAMDVVRAGVEETGHADVGDINLSADANETALTFDLSFGFLGAEVSAGTLTLAAGANATFNETTADDIFDVSEQSTTNVNVSSDTGVSAVTTFSSDFPLVVKPGINAISGTPFDGLSFSVVEIGPTDPPMLVLNSNGNHTLDDFTAVLAGDVLPMFEQLRDWLKQLSKSDQFNIDLPLTGEQGGTDTLGDLLDLGGAFEQDILDQLAAAVDPETETQVAQFKTAQELGALLSQILTTLTGSAVDATPDYDPVAGTLQYDIDWTHTTPSTNNLPLDLSLDLQPVTDVDYNDGVMFNVALAVNDATDDILVSDHGFSDNREVVYDSRGNDPIGGLTNGATYFVRFVDEGTIQLTASPGGSAIDLASPSFPAQHSLTPVSSVLTRGGQTTFDLTVGIDLRTTENFQIAPPLAISGDARFEVPTDGQLTEDLEFNLLINNDFDNPFPVRVTVAETADNGRIADLVADVQRKVDESVVGGASRALGINYAKSSDLLTNTVNSVAAPGDGFDLPELVFGLSLNGEPALPVILPATNHGDIDTLTSNLQSMVDFTTTPRVTFKGIDIEDNILSWPSHGLSTGDEVSYLQGENDDIGLTDAAHYFLIVVDADSIQLADNAVDAANGEAIPLTPSGIATHGLQQVAAPSQVTVSNDGSRLSLALASPDVSETLAFVRADNAFSRGDVKVAQAADGSAAMEFGATTTRINALAFSKGAVAGTPLPTDGVLTAAANFQLFIDGTKLDVVVDPDATNADRLAVLTGVAMTGSTLSNGSLSEDAFMTLTYQLKDGTKETVNVNVSLSDTRAIGFEGNETSSGGVITAAIPAPADTVLANDMTFGLRIDGGNPVLVLLTSLVTEDNAVQPLGFDDITSPATSLRADAGLDQFELEEDVTLRLDAGTAGTAQVTVPAVWTQETSVPIKASDATNIDAATNTIDLPNGHDFINGQAVRYDTAGAAPIEGLVSDQTYFITNALSTSVQLAGPGAPIGLAPARAGESHTLSLEIARLGFDGSNASVVDAASDRLEFGQSHGFLDGTELVYRHGSSSDVYGLADGQKVFVINADATSLQLATEPDGPAISLSPANSGSSHALTIMRSEAEFDGSLDTVVDGGTGILAIDSHGFVTGDRVVYRNGGGSNVVGLSHESAYYVIALGANHLQLTAIRVGSVIDIESPNTSITFDGTDTNVVDAGDTIAWIAHGLNTGDKVFYSAGGGMAVGGLSDGTVYFVINSDPNEVRLAVDEQSALAGTAVDLTSLGTGGSHTLTVETQRLSFNGSDVSTVDDGLHVIDFGFPHGLVNGDELVYRNGGAADLDGLADGDIVYVVSQTDNTVQLAESVNGSPLAIAPAADGTAHALTKVGPVQTFDGANASDVRVGDVIKPVGGHSFVEGQRVEYFNGGGNAIDLGGLTHGNTYFILNATADSFQLAEMPGAAAVNLDLSPRGMSHVVRVANSSLTFDGSSSSFVDEGDKVIRLVDHGLINGQEVQYTADTTPIGNLTDGEVLFVVNATAGTFRLSRAAFGTPIDISPAGGTAHRLDVVHRLTRFAASTVDELAAATEVAIANAGITGVTVEADGQVLTLSHGSENLTVSARQQKLDLLVDDLNLAFAVLRPQLAKPVVATHNGNRMSFSVAQTDSFGNTLLNLNGTPVVDTGATISVLSSGNTLNNDELVDGVDASSSDTSLISDINAALTAAGVDSFIEASLNDNDEIELRGKSGSNVVGLRVGVDVPDGAKTNDDGERINELGFADGQSDSRITALVEDLSTAILVAAQNAGNTAVASDVEVVPLGDLTGNFARIAIQPTNGSSVVSLRLRADIDDPAVTELGFREATDETGESLNPEEVANGRVDLLARGRSDSMYLVDSSIPSVSVTADNNGVSVTGRVGFLPVAMDGAIDVSAGLTVDFDNPDSPGDPVDLDTLTERLDEASTVTLGASSASVVFQVTPVFLGIPGFGTETISAATSDWLNVEPPVFALTLSSADLGGIVDFAGLTYADVIDSLDAAADFLASLSSQSLTDSSTLSNPAVLNPLAAALPSLGLSVTDLLDIAGRFEELVTNLEDEDITTLDQCKRAI